MARENTRTIKWFKTTRWGLGEVTPLIKRLLSKHEDLLGPQLTEKPGVTAPIRYPSTDRGAESGSP